jgi:hypothetical protein
VPQPTDIIRTQCTKCRLCRTSWGYATIAVSLQPCHSQLTLYARNIPNAVCEAPPEDEQVTLETCRGPWFSINWMKSGSRWISLCWYTVVHGQQNIRLVVSLKDWHVTQNQISFEVWNFYCKYFVLFWTRCMSSLMSSGTWRRVVCQLKRTTCCRLLQGITYAFFKDGSDYQFYFIVASRKF